MGINGFTKFYKNIIEKKDLKLLSGKIVVVDVMLKLYKCCLGKMINGTDEINSDGKIISHIVSLFDFTNKLLDRGIFPVYVFDGKSDELKSNTIEKRKKKNVKSINKFSKNNKLDKSNFYVDTKQINECKQLLKYMGIPYVESVGEADQQCAAIASYYKEQVMGILSDDSDMLVFGGTKLLKDFNLKNNSVDIIDRKSILKLLLDLANKIRIDNGLSEILQIHHDNFIDFSIFMGSDYKNNTYGCKLKGIKPDKIFEAYVINDFDVENTITYLQNEYSIISDGFINSFNKIKTMYKKSEVIHPNQINIMPNKINIEKLIDFLCHKNGFNNKYTINKINKFSDNINKFKYAVETNKLKII